MKTIKYYRQIILIIIDILIIFSSYLVSSFLLTNNAILMSNENLEKVIKTIFISIFIYQIIFNLFSIYRNITRYENGRDYLKYIFSAILSTGIVILFGFIFKLNIVEHKQVILSGILIAEATISYRIIIRFILTAENYSNEKKENSKNLLIIGAGEAAREIIKVTKTVLKGKYNLIGLIDDNPNKLNFLISGVKILGDRYQIQEICKQNKVDTIFFSITNIDIIEKKEILHICQETGARLRILPGTADLIKNKTIFQNLRDVEIDDILGREAITLNNDNIQELIEDHVVMVTGGGGSIGSELCRQIVKSNPQKLIIFDIYENNLYNIEMELKQNKLNKTEIIPIVGSVRDKAKLDNVFKRYKPYLVFHAAAHKHVPLMEDSPLEAIKNNIFGTYNAVNCADKYDTKRFILISTDKAVNPTNIMGASKRVCEMIVQAKNKVSKTEFAAVRFGNVLGSNGSVVPLFKKQIIAGGPVTVTHKEITRFFMTISEAVGLVLQAMSYAKGGEIFVLDMGEPVKIYDLAVSLIKLSGLEPGIDIPIEIVGLRPGEKLYEELLMAEEGLTKTQHNKIFIGKLKDITEDEIENNLDKLEQLALNEETTIENIKNTMKEVVPTYKEPERIEKLEIEENSEKINIKKAITKISKTIKSAEEQKLVI